MILDSTKLSIRLGEKVTRTAGWVANSNRGNPIVKLGEISLSLGSALLTLDPVELVPQLIKKERLEAAINILNTGVVHPALSARGGIERPLENTAEDNARNVTPVEILGSIRNCRSNILVHLRDDNGAVGKQTTVDVWEGGKIIVQVFISLLDRSVDNPKQVHKLRA